MQFFVVFFALFALALAFPEYLDSWQEAEYRISTEDQHHEMGLLGHRRQDQHERIGSQW